MTYLRCTIGRWNTDLSSSEGQEAFRRIDDEGLRAVRSQPGFIRYRLMLADPTTTIAVAEWESEELGKPGAQRYREWLRSSGIAEKLSLETYEGPMVDGKWRGASKRSRPVQVLGAGRSPRTWPLAGGVYPPTYPLGSARESGCPLRARSRSKASHPGARRARASTLSRGVPGKNPPHRSPHHRRKSPGR